jgi:hypothetical protein
MVWAYTTRELIGRTATWLSLAGWLAYSLRALKKLPDGGWKVFRAMGTAE